MPALTPTKEPVEGRGALVLSQLATIAVCVVGVGLAEVRAQTVQPHKGSRLEQEVLAVHQARLRALVTGDLKALDRTVSDDLIYTSVAGRVQSKAEILADARSGALKVATADADDVRVRVYGRTTAVVTYRSLANFVDRGETIAGALRATSVYVKRN